MANKTIQKNIDAEGDVVARDKITINIFDTLSHDEKPFITPFSEITIDILEKAKQAALFHLETLNEYKKTYGLESHEFWEYCNAESLVGHLPDWQHLYMNEYGTFARPTKEEMFLEDFEFNITKYERFQSGLILHLISGDSGCGKSTLAKLIIKRLLLNDNIDEFSNIKDNHAKFRFFEISQNFNWQIFDANIKSFFEKQKTDEIFFFYFDDFFALDQQSIQSVLLTLKEASENYKIYLSVTSPSWLLSKKRDLEQLRKDFQLITCSDTDIGGIDPSDRDILKSQYLLLYDNAYRQDLLDLVENEQDMVLVRLALHHNMHYSEYLKNLFKNLSSKWDEYLAAFLLSCTVSRFYVHLSLEIIKELNQGLSKKLPTDIVDYAKFNSNGFKLFRIRSGSQEGSEIKSIPDTIAPFHDRIAQVAYATWEKDKIVPIFNCKLDQLSNKVFKKYVQSAHRKHILANIYRGMLRVAEDEELDYFVNYFGPVQNNNWTLAEDPISSYRWIKFSKFDYKRSSKHQSIWKKELYKNIKNNINLPNSFLSLLHLDPRNLIKPEERRWIDDLVNLDEKYFIQLNAILIEILNLRPIPTNLLADYILGLNKWLVKYSDGNYNIITYRYLIISNMIKISYPILRVDKLLNKAYVLLINSYLTNLENEYFTNTLLAAIKKISYNLNWRQIELETTNNELQRFVENEQNKKKCAPFELLLIFIEIQHKYTVEVVENLTNIFWKIYNNNISFYGLTYTVKSYFNFLQQVYASFDKDKFESIIALIEIKIYDSDQEELAKSNAFPDLLEGIIDCFVRINRVVDADKILNLFKLLIRNHSNAKILTYIIRKTNNLNCPDFDTLLLNHNDIYSTHLRILFSDKIKLPLEQALKDFIVLINSKDLPLYFAVCMGFRYYLNQHQDIKIRETVLKDAQNSIYEWLLKNEDKDEAGFVLPLLTTKLLFNDKLENLELAARIAITQNYIPWWYLNWWLDNGIENTSHDRKYALLNTFWEYALENSQIESNDKFISYEKYYLYLQDHHGITKDINWWANAVEILLKKINSIIEVPKKKYYIKYRGKDYDANVLYYKQRTCLSKIMDSIIENWKILHDISLRTDFGKLLLKQLRNYKNKLWSCHWIAQIAPDEDIDGTELFLLQLNEIEEGLKKRESYGIRDATIWWMEWVKYSGKDFVIETERIYQWMDKEVSSTTSLSVISSLIILIPSIISKFDFPRVIYNKISNVSGMFEEKSALLHDYSMWLCDQNTDSDDDILMNNISYIQSIYDWYLAQLINKSKKYRETLFACYGIQDILTVAKSYNLKFKINQIEASFT